MKKSIRSAYAKNSFKWVLVFFYLSAPVLTNAQQVEWLDSKLLSLEQSGDDNNANTSREIKSLYSDIHSMMNLSGGDIQQQGETAPELVDCDIQSIPLLYKSDKRYKKAAMLRIRIMQPADFLQAIDIARMTAFEGLKYICFLVSFNSCPADTEKNACVPDKVNKMILNSSGKPLLFLVTAEIPE